MSYIILKQLPKSPPQYVHTVQYIHTYCMYIYSMYTYNIIQHALQYYIYVYRYTMILYTLLNVCIQLKQYIY
jgi:hypothetical protein